MPLYKIKHFDDGMVLSFWKIEETESELLSLLSMNERQEIELVTIKDSQSRLRWLASRLAIKSVFENNEPIDLNKDEHGKPFLELLKGHLSLSHSGVFAVCLYHPDKRVGVDIELIKPKIVGISTKFMKTEELSALQNDPAVDQLDAEGLKLGTDHKVESLIACWCAKEAIYKWQGKKGLSMKEGITIHPFSYQECGKIKANLHNGTTLQTLDVYYERVESYMLAYVSSDF